jgi:transposase InsO family protein
MIIKDLIKPIRNDMPRYGGIKLHLDLKDQLLDNDIKIGRDKFLKFLRFNHLLVPKTKRCFITTDSKHTFRRAPNLIKDLVPTLPEQVFVTDITYIRIENDYAYLALVTDLYSKKIMGYKLDDNMRVQLVKDALDMAIKNRSRKNKKVIHHSDRGLQYCCPDYVEYATGQGMIMSNTQNSDPYENAVAERINGILKYEFGLIRKIPSIQIAQQMLKRAVELYNTQRRHCSLQMQTPEFAHKFYKHEYKSYKKIKAAA